MEYWNIGTLEHWNIETLEHCKMGIFKHLQLQYDDTNVKPNMT